ncbi:methionyl-tRNA formyltransferase [Patescibacteria group bacterium]|nr:methionyl-tRNA formyltransferase [Patescibacteria group bacterium]
MSIKTIFFGTHDFAVTILQTLIDDPQISVDLVITQPDKPVGRKKELQQSPIKKLALKYNIEISQPENLKSYALDLTPYTIGVTAQYGLLIPKEILDSPKHGILNVHTSLLPKYRGASPIQSALINGETETGVTIMKMDAGLDTGPIILQKTLKIDENDTYPQLELKLAQIASGALLEAIPDYISGKLEAIPQDDSNTTNCRQFTREDGKIDWTRTAEEIYNQYRGLTPWPGVWTTWDGKRLKLFKIKIANKNFEPGKVLVEDNNIYIGCCRNCIEVIELQLEGKGVMRVKTFLNGNTHIHDQLLGL